MFAEAYGGENPTQVVIQQIDGMRGFDWGSVKDCLMWYEALIWIGHLPQARRNQIIAVPIDFAPLLWGWPLRFQERMAAHNTYKYKLQEFFDDAETVRVEFESGEKRVCQVPQMRDPKWKPASDVTPHPGPKPLARL